MTVLTRRAALGGAAAAAVNKTVAAAELPISTQGAGDMSAPKFRHLFDLMLAVGARDDTGEDWRGRRVFSLIENGRFDGARLRGAVLPGGVDALLVDNRRHRRLDVRLVLRTDTGELVYMSYEGWFTAPADIQASVFDPQTGPSVDPEKYYMRFCASFESGARKSRLA